MSHNSVVKLIRNYTESLMKFGSLGFEIQVTRKDGRGGEPADVYFLNESQSTLLITFMRNSDIVIAFKIALVKAFFELRDKLKSASALDMSEPLSLSHRADNAVQAARTFSAMLRAGRAAGLPLPRALRQANETALRKTGVDILSELDAEDVLTTPTPAQQARPEDSADRFLTAWQRGETAFPYITAKIDDLVLAYHLWCAEHGERRIDELGYKRRAAAWPCLKRTQLSVENRKAKTGRSTVRIIQPAQHEVPIGMSIKQWHSDTTARFSASVGR